MTGAESATLADFRREYQDGDKALRDELSAVRDEVAGVRSQVVDLRADVQPAIDFYVSLNTAAGYIARGAKEAGRAIKYGAGVGASVATIAAATKALGWW